MAMAVYVDELREYSKRAGLWCHMVADELDELHALAQAIGIDRSRFQSRSRHPHYDLNAERRNAAVRRGAVEVSRREIVRILLAWRARQNPSGSSPVSRL